MSRFELHHLSLTTILNKSRSLLCNFSDTVKKKNSSPDFNLIDNDIIIRAEE